MVSTPCTLCHSSNQTVMRDTLRYGIKRNVLRCSDCGFVFLEAATADSTSFYANKNYRNTYGPNLKKMSNAEEVFNAYFPHQAPMVEKIKHLFTPTTSVLDVGCSSGQFLAALKGLVGTRVGLELSQDGAEFIRTKLDFPVYSEPIETVTITEGPFDIVTAFQTVEHVANPIEFVRNLSRQLKPGGYLYLELPNLKDALISAYQVPGYADFYYREPHVSYFTKETLQKLIDQVGLVGEIGTAQRYNFFNHMSWIMTNAPQSDFSQGNGTPKLVTASGVDENIQTELNDFIARVDHEYIALIEKLGMGESLTFLGQLKNNI